VREGVRADAGQLAHIHVRAWREAYRDLLSKATLDAVDEPRSAERWSARLAELDPRSVLVLEQTDGTIVAYACTGPDRDDPTLGELYALYVMPRSWRDGLGRACLNAALERLSAAGFVCARLWVLEGNHDARQFYESMGWREDGRSRVGEVRGELVPELGYWR
jgi:GNAT superfamily N-acetyltransferase